VWPIPISSGPVCRCIAGDVPANADHLKHIGRSSAILADASNHQMLRFVGQKHYADARKALWSVPEPDAIRQQIAFHRLKAAISSGLGEPQNAVLEMRAALKLSPRDPKLSLATAVAEMQAGQCQDALERARNSGSSSTALAIVGDIEDKRGEYEAAAGAYQAGTRSGGLSHCTRRAN